MKLIKFDEIFQDQIKLIELDEQTRIFQKNTHKKKTYSWRGGRGPCARGAPGTRRGAAADWVSARGSGGPVP